MFACDIYRERGPSRVLKTFIRTMVYIWLKLLRKLLLPAETVRHVGDLLLPTATIVHVNWLPAESVRVLLLPLMKQNHAGILGRKLFSTDGSKRSQTVSKEASNNGQSPQEKILAK